MGDEADALYDLAYDDDDDGIATTCCWCKAQIILMHTIHGYKPFDNEGEPHKCPEMDLGERRLSADAIIARIKLNF